MMVIAIDPGLKESGIVAWDGVDIRYHAIVDNECVSAHLDELLGDVPFGDCPVSIAIEMVGHYGTGMPAGKDVFDTCIWIGRFVEFLHIRFPTVKVALIKRATVKTHICGQANAKDGNVRQALIDRLGEPGTKKNPGATYGISSHKWQALALAVYAYDTWQALALAFYTHSIVEK